MTELDIDKSALRAELRTRRRAARDALPNAALAAADAFAAADTPSFRAAALYHPVGAEMDPRPLAALLKRRGVRIGYPVVLARDAPVIFREQPEGVHLVPDAIGIPAPPPEAPELVPDLVVTPLVGFDRRGYRMGQGGGFYDRTLAALRTGSVVFAMGLAYAAQEVEELPIGPYDQRLDAVLTEQGLKLFSGTGDR
jgi:5-formyltetrahydrofolate cyclo-ligase